MGMHCTLQAQNFESKFVTKNDWLLVDSLINNGLNKSAKLEINRIYQISKTTQPDLTNFIRALFYKANQALELDIPVDFLGELQQELRGSKTPHRQIINSVIAGVHYQYYQKNRWKINQRTSIKSDTTTNIQNWSKDDFYKKIRTHFRASLQSVDSLNQYYFADEVFFVKDSLNREYSPSLYDILAFRAIKCYAELGAESLNISGSLSANEKERFLAPANIFLALKFNQQDEDLRLSALQEYQSLIGIHSKYQDTEALIYVDLQRIKYAKTAFLPTEKFDQKYIETLLNLTKKYESNQSVSQVYYELAQTYINRGNNYDHYQRSKYQWEIKKGLEYAQIAVQKYPNTGAAKACMELIETIKKPQFELTIKSVELPDQPILSSLNYTNLDRIYFKLIPIVYLKNENINRFSDEQKIKDLLIQPIFDEWKVELSNEGDFQSHNVQIRIHDVPKGYYALLASSSITFDSLSPVQLNYFLASGISFINREDASGNMDVFVLNRKSGKPLSDVKLEVQSSVYNQAKKDYQWKSEKILVSGKNGYVRLLDLPKSKDLRFIFTHKKDTLIKSGIYSRNAISLNERIELNTNFFTDRSIYRPGQTIYFKGIVYQKKNGRFEVVPNQNTKVEFFDGNHKLLKSLKLLSNEFGSFNGSLIIPMNNLGGNFLISNENGSTNITVEEYKRPNFEIVFDTLKTQFRLNDTVIISGQVNSFSRYPISEAQLKFKVKRSNYQMYFSRSNFYYSPKQQINYGELKTDENGRFRIKFFAQSAEDSQELAAQFFNFTIEVESTDIVGETQSAITSIRLGYANLIIKPDLPEKVNQRNIKMIPIVATDLNDVPQSVNYVASIYKLKNPVNAFKKRNWRRPDRFLTDVETFYTYFEHEQFDDEKNFENLGIDYQAFQAELNTTEVSGINLPDIANWSVGIYKLIIKTEDQFDVEVVHEKYFVLYDPKSAGVPYPEINWFVLDKNIAGIKDSLGFVIGSAMKNLSVLYELQQDNKVIQSQWLQLDKAQKRIRIPLTKMNGKDFNINLIFVSDNEIYEHNEHVTIVDPVKELKLKLETFRPIILPGSKEEWKIKIIGKEKPITELLVSMMDASLDKIKLHQWQFTLPNYSYNQITWNTSFGFDIYGGRNQYNFYRPGYFSQWSESTPQLKWDFINNSYSGNRILKSMAGKTAGVMTEQETDAQVFSVVENIPEEEIKIRTNFSETAFFYPSLKTDEAGNAIIKFTSPESLTRWKFMVIGHTKNLRIAALEQNIITQKKLMIKPNLPRFLRSGDTLYFSSQIINLSEKVIQGKASLKFFDASNMKPVIGIITDEVEKSFKINANSSLDKQWKLVIPNGINAVVYRLTATSENFSDGEERIIPILSDKILVTESLPIHLNPKEEKKIVFENLVASADNKALVHHQLKFEMTTNPAWYAVLALPYIAEGNSEDAISLYNRFYANTMAAHLLKSQPQIRPVFKAWKAGNSSALNSQLEKNPELKSVLLEETPWLMDARNESEQRKKLGLFFDDNQISQQLRDNLSELLKNQLADGSWSWFKGMYGSRYITQQIVSGLVRLRARKVFDKNTLTEIEQPMKDAIQYLNRQLVDDYQYLKNNNKLRFANIHLSNIQIQHLFLLSYLSDFTEEDAKFKSAIAYYFTEEQKFWMERSEYMQGMIALTLFRYGDTETAELILASLKERAVQNEELGIYWPDMDGFYWYQAPVETQAFLIEVFSEIGNNKTFVAGLKKWLLKQKQTRMWSNPRASVDAVNALLTGSANLLSSQIPVQVKFANKNIEPQNVEAGTGFSVRAWQGNEIKANMGNVHLKNLNTQMAWGAMHWQYFDQLDQIYSSKGILNIEKKLFLKETTKSGNILIPIADRKIKIGDKIVSRMIIELDRDMEFVHINDMRALAFEPVQVLSGYKFEDGVGYYKKISDLATNYFFDLLKAGSYIIENEMYVTQKGTFSNGISTIQCLYAPEFSSHSEGIRVIIE